MNITMHANDNEDTSKIEIYAEQMDDITDLIDMFISFARALGYADVTLAYAMADHDFVRSHIDEEEDSE